jgi:hypothetical protein
MLFTRIVSKVQFLNPHSIEQVPIKEQPFRKLKYSELMEWHDQMLKEVGLNVPPCSSTHFKKTTDSQIDVIFIKKSSINSSHKRKNHRNDESSTP